MKGKTTFWREKKWQEGEIGTTLLEDVLDSRNQKAMSGEKK